MAGAQVSISSPGNWSAVSSKVSVAARPPSLFCHTCGKNGLQMVRPGYSSRNLRTVPGWFDIRVAGTFMPHWRASTSCTDLLLMNREAVYLLTHRKGRVSRRYISERENQRYSPSADFLADSVTFGLATSGWGRRIQTTSPGSTG